MVRNALINLSKPPASGEKQQPFQPHFSQLPTGLSGAKLILRPSMMRALNLNHKEVSSRIRDRLCNKME